MRSLVFILITFFCLLDFFASADNAPVTTCGSVANASPGAVDVPVTVAGFSNIGSVSLAIRYEYLTMHFTGYAGNPDLIGLLVGDFNLGNGLHQLSVAWYGNGATLANGSTLVTLHFDYLDGNSGLTFFDDGSSCEYTNDNFQILNDTPFEYFYVNGQVCGPVGAPGTISGPAALCQGQSGAVYSINPMPNASGYDWTVPAGAVISAGQGTNLIIVDFPVSAGSGIISVLGYNPCSNSPSAQLSVNISVLPVANAGNDQAIPNGSSTVLHAASGGSGSFTYHWSPENLLVNPGLQDAQTVNLTTTNIFTLTVTNQATGCQSTDEVTVAVTGGALSVNPVAIPSGACSGSSVRLFANAGGGNGIYFYSWTCIPPGNPPWASTMANPEVVPDTSTQYLITVDDGIIAVNSFVNVTVYPLPSATISGGDTLCGTGNTAELTVDLQGTPPLSFIYSNGLTSHMVVGQETSPYTIFASEPGTYKILEVHDLTCTGNCYDSATVYLFPLPETPEITVNGYNLTSSSCCGNQWYKEGQPIPGATSQYYTCTESGLYSVAVILNGCSSIPSEAVDIIVGIEEYDDPGMTLIPNPARNFILVRLSSSINGPYTINLYSPDHRLVRSQTFSKSGSLPASFDLSGLSRGLYILQLTSPKNYFSQKLIIN
jgi:hypothetical protein